MQRAFLRIAQYCVAAGAGVRVYALEWQGPRPTELEVVLCGVRGLFNHTRYERFQAWVREQVRDRPVACLVGFNKMPGLDVYYAADPCYLEKAHKARTALYRRTPRYRFFAASELSVFGAQSETAILMSSPTQEAIYQTHYATPAERFHRLPPGIARDRMAGEDAPAQRARGRAALGVASDEKLVLFIGSGFVTKGLDRAIAAVASLPDALRRQTRLVAIGADNPRRYVKSATSAGIGTRFAVYAGRDDIPDILQAGDLLLHPAYFENTGNVLLEAVVAGLPVLATDACGFSRYVTEAEAGCVLGAPFRQEALNAALARMLEAPERAAWRQHGIAFGRTHDLYSLPERAGDIILARAAGRLAAT